MPDPKGFSEDHEVIVFGENAPSQSCEQIDLVLETLRETISLEAVTKDKKSLGALYRFNEAPGDDIFCVIDEGSGTSFLYGNKRLLDLYERFYNFGGAFSKGYFAFTYRVPASDIVFDAKNHLVWKDPFWACNKIPDPLRWSDRNKIIVYGPNKPNDSCIEVDILKKNLN